MSRRRTRSRAATSPSAPAPVAAPSTDAELALADSPDAEALRRRAVELREARMGRASAASTAAAPVAAATADPTIHATVPVKGMTCRTCEVRIDRYVGRIPGVTRVSSSAVHGRVDIESTKPVPRHALAEAIGRAGYEIGRTPWIATDLSAWLTALAGAILVLALTLIARAAGIDRLAASTGDLSSGGVLVALLLGLAAGVSTCMALVGGLVLGLSASYAAHAPGRSAAGALRPAVLFVGGRIVGYAAFGAVLGAIGASVAMPPELTAVLMLVVAVVMTILGTRLTGLSPRIAAWSPTLPMGLARRLGLTTETGEGAAYSDARAAGLGALSFFLPCGFTQAVQVYALSTGSPVLAAALLGVFAIGTAPGLLALAGLPAILPTGARPVVLRVVGVVVLAFAFTNAAAGLRLVGAGLPSLAAPAAAAELDGVVGADGYQAVTTRQDADGYSPSNVVIYAGYPTHWTVESSTTATCAASIWAPSVGVRERLHEGANVIELPALPAGVLRYTCSMGMYAGQITVVEPPATKS